MLFPLVVLFFYGVAFLGHAAVARALGAPRQKLMSTLLGIATPPGPPRQRWLQRLAGLLTVYAVLVVLFGLGSLAHGDSSPSVRVMPGLPAALAGLQDGDRVVAVQGQPVSTFAQLAERLTANGPRPVELQVLRGTQAHTLRVEPTVEGRIGVGATTEAVAVRPLVRAGRALIAPLQALVVQGHAVGAALGSGAERPPPGVRVDAMQGAPRPEAWGGWGYLSVLAFSGTAAWALLLLLALVGALRSAASRLRTRPAPGTGGR